MCVTRLVLACLVGIISVPGALLVAAANEQVMLRAGEAAGSNAVFALDNGAKPRQIVVRTTRAGVAGSRIEVTVDKAKKPALSHIFTTQECKFGDNGSECEVVIPASEPIMRRSSPSSKQAVRATSQSRTLA